MKNILRASLVNCSDALHSRGFACLAGLILTASTLTLPASAGVTIAITSPTNGASLATPANFQLKASASTTTGTITNVSFFQGSNFLTNDNVAPYSVNVDGLQIGNYTFTARASDSTGHKGTNSIVVHVVLDTVKPTV